MGPYGVHIAPVWVPGDMGPQAMGSIWVHMDPYLPIWVPYGAIWTPYGRIWDPYYGFHMGPYGAHMGSIWAYICPGSSGARNSSEILDFEGIASGTTPLWGEGGRQPTAQDHIYIYIYIYMERTGEGLHNM